MNKVEKIDTKTQLVLNAATVIFLEHGYSAATTDMIQKQAGVSKATVYSRYPNKETLFIAVIETECTRLTNQVRTIELNSKSIRESFTHIGYEYLTILLSPAGLALYRVIVAESQRFNEVGKAFYNAGPKVVLDMLSNQISSAVEKGEITLHSMSAQEAASIFLSMLRADAQLQCLTHPQSSPSEIQIERWVYLAVEVFLNSFKINS